MKKLTLDRPTQTVSLKVLADRPEEIFAVLKSLDRVLPGVQLTSGIRPSERTQSTATRFDYRYFAFALVSFELTPSGEARPTQRNSILAFKAGRQP